jgi:hypothetical protein
MTTDAMIVGSGIALRIEAVEHINQEQTPSDKQNEHEPMNEAIHVVHQFTVLGSQFGETKEIE